MSGSPQWTTKPPAITYDECRSCGQRWTLPRTGCPQCGTPDPQRRAAAGRGRVTAVSLVHPASGQPYVLVLVDLDEGVRTMGRAEPGLLVGALVEAQFVDRIPSFVERTGATHS